MSTVEASSNATSLISLHKVSKRYSNTAAVDEISFNVHPGECLVLIGHNGAGKTTLMKLMLGLTRPTSGSIEVLGSNPAHGTSVARHKQLGYLPESVAFYDAMTGREVLEFYAQLKNIAEFDRERLLQLVGLSEAANRRDGTYSKGMRQRLGLAQAMLGEPRLLFLDEPTTGLDPSLRHHFYELIGALHNQGTTSIISSHALNEVEARADRFIIMKAGAIVAIGTLQELYEQSALPVHMHIKVSPGEAPRVAEQLDSKVTINRVNNQSLDLSCLSEQKMPLIRHLTGLGDSVHDMQIMPPQLDEVYKYFMQGDRPA